MPKFFSQTHKLTKWLINQMRSRNGLHRLVYFVNRQSEILSAHFEIIDEPNNYPDSDTGSVSPAYSTKTILYLTPLAIAAYLGYQSVIQVLLDDSSARLHAHSREHVDVNATCYGRRNIWQANISGADEIFTTSPIIIAIRRECYVCLRLLISGTRTSTQNLIYLDHLGTSKQTTHTSIDIMDYAMKLMSYKPGLDIVHIYHILQYQSKLFPTCWAPDLMAYNIYSQENSQPEIWCSLFHRLCKMGLSRTYSNCGSKIIQLLENIEKSGFFRQDFMSQNTISYDTDIYRGQIRKTNPSNTISPHEIRNLGGAEAEAAKLSIAIDRDTCLAFLTVWLNQLTNNCLERLSYRIMKLFLSILHDTNMLNDFFNSLSIEKKKINSLSPSWLQLIGSCNQPITRSFDDNFMEYFYVDCVQLEELKLKLAKFANNCKYIDQSSVEVGNDIKLDLFENGRNYVQNYNLLRKNASGDHYSKSTVEVSENQDSLQSQKTFQHSDECSGAINCALFNNGDT